MFRAQSWKSKQASGKRKVPEQSCIRKIAEPWGWDGEGIISSPLKEGEKGMWMECEQRTLGAGDRAPRSPLQGVGVRSPGWP